MKKFINGDWSAESIFTVHFERVIVQRDGTRIINENKAKFASGKWWIHAQLLDVVKTPLQAVMALIGYDDSFANDTFNTFYARLCELAVRLGGCRSTSCRGPRSRRSSSRSPPQR